MCNVQVFPGDIQSSSLEWNWTIKALNGKI